MNTKRKETEQRSILFNQSKGTVQVLTTENTITNDLKSSALNLAHHKGMRNQILVVSSVLLSCIAGGVHIGCPAVLLPQLLAANTTNAPNEIPIDMEKGSWIASIFILSTPWGAFFSGPMSDSFGRRNTLILTICPMIISWCITAVAQSYHVLLLARLISGFAIGIIGGPMQIYIAEVTEPKLRGFLTCTPFVMYSAGILLANISAAFLHWRVVSWMAALLSTLSIIPLFCIPESPSWLLRSNKEDDALKALKTLRGHEVLAEDELKDMQNHLNAEFSETKENIIQLCLHRTAYKPLTIVTVFTSIQLFTGNFIIINYANDFFERIGNITDVNSAIIGSAIARNVCSILFCGMIMVIPIRSIIITSGVSSGVLSLLISIFLYANGDKDLNTLEGYLVCGGLMMYIIFNTPIAIVPGVIIGELLPAKVRGRCAGFVFFTMNVLLFVVIKWYPYFKSVFKLSGVFLFFTFANLACTIFIYLFQPETMGRTLDEIENYFNKDNWLWNRRDKIYKQVKQAD